MLEGEATDVENGGNFWGQDLGWCFYWSVIINVTFALSNNWNVALFSQGSTAFYVKKRRLNVRSNLLHWKKKIFSSFRKGGGASQPFFLDYVIDKWAKICYGKHSLKQVRFNLGETFPQPELPCKDTQYRQKNTNHTSNFRQTHISQSYDTN